MSKKRGKLITMTPGFAKPAVGDVISVGDVIKAEAVDWGQVTEEESARSEFTIVRGTIYGQVLTCNDEWISIAFQVFETGNVRGVLSVPWCAVTKVTILKKGDDDD